MKRGGDIHLGGVRGGLRGTPHTGIGRPGESRRVVEGSEGGQTMGSNRTNVVVGSGGGGL